MAGSPSVPLIYTRLFPTYPPPDAERSPTSYFPPTTPVLKMPVDTTRTVPTRRAQRKMTEEEMKEIEMKRIRGKRVERSAT